MAYENPNKIQKYNGTIPQIKINGAIKKLKLNL